MSLKLDQQQNNKGVNHIGELPTVVNATVFLVSSNLIDARMTRCSNNPLFCVTSNIVMLEGSSQQAILHPNLNR
ncbi:hypothetical protein QQP08_022585 [Theobroma cacao]|nr:hypothetical protein QQP08_022585 [Theobroma cacao]